MGRYSFGSCRTPTPGCPAVSSFWSRCSGWGGVRMWVSMCEWPNPYPRQPSRSSVVSMCSGWGGSPSGGSNPYPQACTACEAPEGAVLRPIPGRGWASCIRLAAQGLGPGCGLHERVADPKAKAVRVGCSSSPARTPLWRHCTSWCACGGVRGPDPVT